MRISLLVLALALLAPTTRAQSLAPPPAPPNAAALTLAEAMRRAEAAHPNVRTQEAKLAAAQGLRSEASSPLFNNPELNLSQTRRRSPSDGSVSERDLGISQAFETGGQQGHRRTAASANLLALEAEIADARAQARAEASQRFHAVLVALRRVQIEQRSLTLLDSTASAVETRRRAGEDTRLDANVALIEAERSRNALALAQEQLLEARAELATVLQLPPEQLPELAGTLPTANNTVTPPAYDLNQLLASTQSLPRFKALQARQDFAQSRLAVERASRSPDVTVGLTTGREGPPSARERVTTLSLSLPLPIFKRNSAAIGQAMSDLTQVEVERASAVRDREALVRKLWLRLQSQQERVARLQRALLPASVDNQQLTARSRQAGQIGVLDQILVNRQALDAEREVNEAMGDLLATRIELEQTAGWLQEGTAP